MECLPSKEPSLIISVNQNCINNTNIIKLNKKILLAIIYLFTHKITPVKTLNKVIATKIGQGDGLII